MAEIVKAEKIELTVGRIAKFKCDEGKMRSYLWCKEVKGLGIIATAAGSKSYIFQTKVNGKSMRLTIGSVSVWSIVDAQKEARRLQTIIDQGNDPREVKADKKAAEQAAIVAKKEKEVRETVTVGMAWDEYVTAMKTTWGSLHLHDHVRAMQSGGEQRLRSKKLTAPGTLASLAAIRLIDLTTERMAAWAKIEGMKRAGRARNARTLLSTFLNWCIAHPVYGGIVSSNPAQSKEVKRYLGKAAAKNDSLQREQLSGWFSAVKQIQNPIVSAYLQTLLLTGARPNELVSVRWEDVNFQWNSMAIRDKVEGLRVIPLLPYVENLLATLPRRNQWVFSSPTSASGHLAAPHIAHNQACAIAGLDVTLHGLRRSFASLCEWIECPAGIAAQIQGHKPSGVREKHYIRRPLDLLRMWHVKIEAWILNEAGIEFTAGKVGLRSIN